MRVIQSFPLGYYDDTGKAVGVHTEVFEAIERHSGICIRKVISPIARIWRDIELGRHDGSISFYSPRRKHLVETVGLIRLAETSVIAKKSIKISGYDDLYGLLIAHTRGSRLADKFDQDAGINRLEVTNYQQAAKMLNFGRVDAIAGNTLVLTYQLNRIIEQSVKQNAEPSEHIDLSNKVILGYREQWLQMTKSSEYLHLIPPLQIGIRKMHEHGDYQAIMRKYYKESWLQIEQGQIQAQKQMHGP